MTTARNETNTKTAIVWFRRDLRLSDHPALSGALKDGMRIIPLYILGDVSPGPWRLGGASRWWLAQSLRALDGSLRDLGSRLILRQGPAIEVIQKLCRESGAEAVYFTRGYEPFQRRLEEKLPGALKAWVPRAAASADRF